MVDNGTPFTRVRATRNAPLLGAAVLVVVVAGLVVDADKAGGDNFYASMLRMDKVAQKIHESYVEEVGSADLVDNAINGMLTILDPHSIYFQEKQYEELRIHTEGEFGGLGIQIAIRDKLLTVMTPIGGTPAARAGIQSGDQILKIDGKPTLGISVDEAVQKLRGQPGTEVTITIRRKGEPQDMDYSITREIIRIKSVPYCGVVEGSIGYVRLLQFSQESGTEIEKAIRELLPKKLKGFVLDLRGNPGGLLPQAIEVADKFVEKGALVVATRGRERSQNQQYKSNEEPVLPANIPLVVLVNAASASASEIVAGAIQDWDRGVILGDTTFGKGSVQSILTIPDDKNHKLKLTMAFYYTPSGRCINKPENGVRGAHGEHIASAGEDDEEGPADTAKADSVKVDTTTYRTQDGRAVHGGGGIVPDTVVDLERFPAVVAALLGHDVFFRFANIEYPLLKKRGVSVVEGYQADEATLKRFYQFLDSTKFSYRSQAQVQFGEFKKRAGLVKDTSDTSKAAVARSRWLEPERALGEKEVTALKEVVQRVDTILADASRRSMAEQRDHVRTYVSEALLVRALGQDDPVIYRRRLADDAQLTAATGILRNAKEYQRLLASQRK